MNISPCQSTAQVPAWVSEVPPLDHCCSCGGISLEGCTDCQEQVKISQISDVEMQQASTILSYICRSSSLPVLALQGLLWDIDTKYDENGNEYPGIYPYWNSIAGYRIAKEFIRSLEESMEECSAVL